MNQGTKYWTVEQVPASPWLIQGTVYLKLEDAKFAAMKLFCNTTGVIVKRYSRGGWELRYWRRNNLAA